MRKRSWALLGWALVLVTATLLLISATPPLLRQVGLSAPGPTAPDLTPPSPDAAVAVAAAVGAWLILGWICLGLALSFAEVCAGVAGRRIWCPVSTAARRVTPARMRTAIRTSLQAGLVAGSTGAILAATAGAAQADLTDPKRWPSADRLATDRVALDRVPRPERPLAQPAARYRVRPGDTLWSISAAYLPPGAPASAIAASWPRWWSANRQLIGSDPDLIRPGQRLRPPSRVSEATP